MKEGTNVQWGQIKNLLIISFLLLDIYLLVQFIEKQETADMSILETSESSIEENLKEEDIKVVDLPTKEYEEPFISASPKKLTNEDENKIKALANQTPEIVDGHFIFSEINKKVKIPKEQKPETMDRFIESLVFKGDQYRFWRHHKETNVVIYFQEQYERPIYYNQNSLILLFLNDKNEVKYYTQTLLDDYKQSDDKNKLIQPMTAVETLYRQDELSQGDEIIDVEMGFHTRVPLESGIQVFAPTWKINIKGKRSYFVNAIEGFVFSTERSEFLTDSIESTISKVKKIKNKKINKLSAEHDLKELLDVIERSEDIESGI